MSMTSGLRSMVSRWLTDVCTIRARRSIAYDEDLGYEVDTAGDIVHRKVGCMAQPYQGAREVQAGEAEASLARRSVYLEPELTGLEVNQELTFDESSDPYLVGRVMRIVDVVALTGGPYRRVDVEEVLPLSEEGS